MKALIFSRIHSKFHSLLLLTLCLINSLAAADTGITATANVVADCSMSVPPVIKLDTLSTRDLSALHPGERLSAWAVPFTLTGKCYGTRQYRYTFSSDRITDSCMATGRSGVALCLKAKGRDLELSASGTELTLLADGSSALPLEVVPQRTSGMPEAGNYTTILMITLSPL